MFLRKQTHTPSHLLADNSNVEELRAQRIWRLARVLWISWAIFIPFFVLRRYTGPCIVCVFECVAISAIVLTHRGQELGRHRLAMYRILAAGSIGLLLVALSHPSLHMSMLFFSVSILVASQLLGVRAAFHWMVVSLTAQTVFSLLAYDLTELFNSRLDELTLMLGNTVCVFLCCRQGEEFYHDRTKGLIRLSQQLKVKGKRLQKLASTDSLTGLLNRHQFQTELTSAVRSATVSGKRMALLLVDMDGFKEINDTLGHPVGDLAIKEIAKRLSREFSDQAVIARLGGDEFCLIFPAVQTAQKASEYAELTRETLAERYTFDACSFPLSASVGVALCPDDADSATELLSCADKAMFAAKENKKGQMSYARKMTEELEEYRRSQEELSHALQRNEFFLAYQPQVCVDTGHVFGVEALLRWRRDGQVISPIHFVPLLEKSREIIPVGKWIVHEACRQLREWEDEGFFPDMSINVSAIQFRDETFIDCIADPIREFDLDATRLDFEVTESVLIDDVQQAIDRLGQIKETGASISIDDFGTGYSSLAYLRQFPLDRLKIDRAFVKDIPDSDDGVIAASVVALSKAIGVSVLAEGVETKEQLDFLKSIDCDECQGYYFSQPVAADQVTAFLAPKAMA